MSDPSKPKVMASSSAESSGIYSLLPTAFTSRVPDFSTVRRRISQKSETRASTPASQRTRSTSASSTNSIDSTATTIAASGTATPASRPSPPPEQLCMSRAAAVLTERPNPGIRGGIDLESAAIGTTLATTALSRLESDGNDSAGRGMYVDAVKYMIRGLPQDLSDSEKCALEASGVNMTQRKDGQYSTALTTTTNPTTPSKQSSNFVRASSARIVSLMLSSLFSLIMIGIPLFALLFTRMLQYERRHRLSERAVEGTRSLASAASTAMVRAGQTRSGAYFLALVLCVVQNILEGAGDGINQSTVEWGTRFRA